MKKIISFLILVFLLPLTVKAQGMMGNRYNQTIDDDHTFQEEQTGKVIWQQFNDKQVACVDLSDEQFRALGEYFMGRMMGQSHAAMNQMMTQMMGEEGEIAMHIVMGKRFSGCEEDAAWPISSQWGMMPMMQMMMGGLANWSPYFLRPSGQKGGIYNMMGNFSANPMGWLGFGLGGIFMLLFWALVIVAIVYAIRWLARGNYSQSGNSAVEILRERYARGEIDRKEFESKKKDLEK